MGQILWQTWSSLLPIAAIYAAVLIIWFVVRPSSDALLFYLTFAVSVTASVQIVGIYLVFASLIVPALATTGIHRGSRLLAGYGIGALSFLVGIIVSIWLDLPTGAVIVWSMAVIALLTGLVISDKRQAS